VCACVYAFENTALNFGTTVHKLIHRQTKTVGCLSLFISLCGNHNLWVPQMLYCYVKQEYFSYFSGSYCIETKWYV